MKGSYRIKKLYGSAGRGYGGGGRICPYETCYEIGLLKETFPNVNNTLLNVLFEMNFQ